MIIKNFEFLIRRNETKQVHLDIEFFYVMSGTAEFSTDGRQYHMEKEDFLLVNADEEHWYTASEDFMAASLQISYGELCELLHQDMFVFWCNTVTDETESSEVLCTIMKQIIAEQYINHGNDQIRLYSLYYQFLHVLTNDFLVNRQGEQAGADEHKFDERKRQIAEYVNNNYDQQISLSELARKLFLSDAYLSKYFKRQFGTSFVNYVNSVRLNFAVSKLLHSDKSVVRIAMDTGFASSAAMNKAFREKYGVTPTVYRTQWRKNVNPVSNTLEDQEKVQTRLQRFFIEHPSLKNEEKKRQQETVRIGKIERRLYNKDWDKLINIGTAEDLLNSDMQQHLLYLKKTLHFEYVRFWDLYAPNMFLNMETQNDEYNFSKLDRVLDFLTANDLKPYIELREKPKILIQNAEKITPYQKRDRMAEDEVKMREFVSRLIIHLISRYTAEVVQSWYFELWKIERDEYVAQVNIPDARDSNALYLDCFDDIASTLRQYLPGIRIGGGGFSLRYGEELFRELLLRWKERAQKPSFVSIYNYPYSIDSIDKGRNQAAASDFLRNHLERIRAILEQTDFNVPELHVSEWNFSVSSRNVLNDHCMKGAYLVKNLIDNIGLVTLSGYWLGSDIFSDFSDSNLFLNGGGGLLSKDGVPKPAFYAFEFMNRLGKYLIQTGEHYIITDNGAGNWRIVCHNLKKLGYQYGLRKENEQRLEEQNNLFTDLKRNEMVFELPALREGKYQISVYSVNQQHGSIQDEWREMSNAGKIGPEECEYLRRITTPKLVLQACKSENGILAFNLVLEPNEIVFIHVSYQYL